MPIQKISFQNNSITKQTQQQQNVSASPVATNSTGDTVEISTKKKENKVLKYTLIGVGALLGIVAIAKHKSIAKIFEKAPEFKPKNTNVPESTAKVTSESSHTINTSSHSPSSANATSHSNNIASDKTIPPANDKPKATATVTEPIPKTVRPKIIGVDTSILDKEELNLWQRLSDTKSENYDQELIGQLNGLKRNRIRDIFRNTIEDVKSMQGARSVEERNKLEKSIIKRYVELTDDTKFTPAQQTAIQVENKKNNKISNTKINSLIRKARKGNAEALNDPKFIEYVERLKRYDDYKNIDVLNPPRLYRKVGKSEVDALLNGEFILSNDPHYNGVIHASAFPDVWDGGYRITFKPKEQFDLALENEWYLPHTEIKCQRGEHCRIYGGYTLDDVEAIQARGKDGDWTEFIYPKANETKIKEPTKTTSAQISEPIQKHQVNTQSVTCIKKLSDIEVRSLVKKSLDAENKYKLSDSERAIIQNKYGSYSQEYIKNLCNPIDEDGIKFMTKLANVCDGKYTEYWKNNPDKLILITNGGTLRNKIDINASEHEWDIIINSFKTFFSDKTDMHNLKAVMDYKQCLFEKINCTLTNKSEISNILKSIEGKESLNDDEIKKIKSTLNYLKGLTGYQMPGITADLIPQFDSKFDNIIKHLNTGKLNRSKINQIKSELLNLQSDILNYRKEDNVQGVADFLANLIEKHGESLENVKLNRYERSIENSILSTIEIDGHSLTNLMKQATDSNDNSIITRICNHLNTEQPSLERGSFMSTSLSPFKIIDEHPPIQWTLKSNKDVKGLYIEDLYNVLYGRGNKDGNEVELLVQRGSKIKIKKAEFKNGVWQLEGVISPSTVPV